MSMWISCEFDKSKSKDDIQIKGLSQRKRMAGHKGELNYTAQIAVFTCCMVSWNIF